MSDQQAPQPGAPAMPNQASAQMEAQQPQRAPSAPGARKGYAAAFGDGSGAAWVVRDLASI